MRKLLLLVALVTFRIHAMCDGSAIVPTVKVLDVTEVRQYGASEGHLYIAVLKLDRPVRNRGGRLLFAWPEILARHLTVMSSLAVAYDAPTTELYLEMAYDDASLEVLRAKLLNIEIPIQLEIAPLEYMGVIGSFGESRPVDGGIYETPVQFDRKFDDPIHGFGRMRIVVGNQQFLLRLSISRGMDLGDPVDIVIGEAEPLSGLVDVRTIPPHNNFELTYTESMLGMSRVTFLQHLLGTEVRIRDDSSIPWTSLANPFPSSWPK